MTIPEVHVQPTDYRVTCFPEGYATNVSVQLVITVGYRGLGRWAITRRGRWCLSRRGVWDPEPISLLDVSEKWVNDHTYDLDEALELAKAHAPFMTYNGHTVAGVLADIEKETR